MGPCVSNASTKRRTVRSLVAALAVAWRVGTEVGVRTSKLIGTKEAGDDGRGARNPRTRATPRQPSPLFLEEWPH
eukprot:7767-Pyramimonas_sp.AAC.1